MTGKERIKRILKRQEVDRIGLFEHFWGDTLSLWISQGHIKKDEDLSTHFNFDMSLHWAFNQVADLDWKEQVVSEDADSKLVKNGNRATLRWNKFRNGTPEHVAFDVTERSGWESFAKPLLTPDRRRIDFDGYKKAKAAADAQGRFFCWSGVNVFEQMHPLCGHENLLLGMALDPDWIKDMAQTYATLNIESMKILFAEAGKPDGLWFYEDMGFKGRPFMSPEMYNEMILPFHKLTIDFAHSLGLQVVMHSCGFVEPLIPGIVEAGVDCLQVMEVKAGMDPLRIKRLHGDKLSLCGGFDARNLVANDLDAVRAELETKIPALKEGGGYILHSDHSIPCDCKYETYRKFVDMGMSLGRY